MSRIRAKFNVVSVTRHYGGSDQPIGSETVTLMPVYSSDPTSENHAFWKASPSGKLEMNINNPQAHGVFQPGQQYYIDFTPCDN